MYGRGVALNPYKWLLVDQVDPVIAGIESHHPSKHVLFRTMASAIFCVKISSLAVSNR